MTWFVRVSSSFGVIEQAFSINTYLIYYQLHGQISPRYKILDNIRAQAALNLPVSICLRCSDPKTVRLVSYLKLSVSRRHDELEQGLLPLALWLWSDVFLTLPLFLANAVTRVHRPLRVDGIF